MTTPPSTPQSVAERIESIRYELGAVIGRTSNVGLQEQWRDCETRLLQVLEENAKRPEVVIALIGSTGAGKSSLLNALLGARLLPVSNMRACTAAISEVTYADGGGYEAEIEFLSRTSWHREIEVLLADIADMSAGDLPTDNNNNDAAWSRILGTVKDILWRSRANRPEAEAAIADIPRVAREKLRAVYCLKEDADSPNFQPSRLEEPPEITRALDAGVEVIQCDTLDAFRKRIAVYLDSKHRYWPIVKAVKIRGPFAALSSGAKLVDLPGLNDPNEAREEVTRTYLKTCRFVWIVFNIKRVLTRDTITLMMSDDFLRQVVMDGRAGALTFVGTASDDIDLESGREEFGLSEDASVADVVLARNTAARAEVARQLIDLSSRLARMAGENEARAKALAETFSCAEIFTVSAREFLRLTNLENIEQTEIPALCHHMADICSGYGVEAQALAHRRQIELSLAEIQREISTQQMYLDQRTEISRAQREEIEQAATAACTFLDTRIGDHRERFEQDLEAGQELLRERLRRAVDRASRDLDQVVQHWSGMHWATIRAVVRRDGTYVGPSGRHDFPTDLAKPILYTITFAWSDFFGDHLGRTLERWTQRLLGIADDHRRNLLDSVGSLAAPHLRLRQGLKDVLDTTEKVLAELLAQLKTDMEQKIEMVRRNLYDCIPDQVRANMRPAFEKAAKESGTGMKLRILEILARQAREVSSVMFADAEQAILQGVRGLNDWLARKYGDMAETVSRHAGIAAENLKLDSDQMSATAIEKEREELQDIAQLVTALMYGLT